MMEIEKSSMEIVYYLIVKDSDAGKDAGLHRIVSHHFGQQPPPPSYKLLCSKHAPKPKEHLAHLLELLEIVLSNSGPDQSLRVPLDVTHSIEVTIIHCLNAEMSHTKKDKSEVKGAKKERDN